MSEKFESPTPENSPLNPANVNRQEAGEVAAENEVSQERSATENGAVTASSGIPMPMASATEYSSGPTAPSGPSSPASSPHSVETNPIGNSGMPAGGNAGQKPVTRQVSYYPPSSADIAPTGAMARPQADRGNMWAYNEGAAVITPRAGEDSWEENSLQTFFGMLWRRRAILLATMALVLAVTAIYMILTPPLYRSVATLQVRVSDPNSSSSSTESTLVMADVNGMDRSLDTQLTILQSDQVKRGAIKRLSPELISKLQSYYAASIDPVGTTALINITVTSHDPKASQALADAYCDEYIQLSRAENRNTLEDSMAYVSDQKDKVGKKLNAARDAVQKFKQANKIFDVQTEATGVTSTLLNIKNSRESLKAEQAANQVELQRTAQLIPAFKKFDVLPGSTVIRPEVQAVKGEITNLELKRLELLQKYRADRPEIQSIDDQLAALHRRLQGEARTEINTWSNAPNPIRTGLESSIVSLQVKNWTLQARDEALAKAEENASNKLEVLPSQERTMDTMMLKLTSLTDSYSVLSSKQDALQMAQEAKVANASQLFPAEASNSPVNTLVKTLGSALLAGLIVALALVALVDWLDDGVYGEAEAKMVSHLPVLAQIPSLGKDAQASVAALSDASNDDKHLMHLRESFRMLRTMIALTPGGQSSPGGYAYNADGTLATVAPTYPAAIRSVVVTSSLPNEGKTLSSAHLAAAAASSGEQVILVDCDLRHPSLHRLFELSNDIGLTSVAGGISSLDDALQDTSIPNLRVLTTGPLSIDPLRILNSPGARACFDEMREIADFIVIDTPPALVYPEAQIAATMADGMLMVISSKDAKKREVTRTRDLFEQTGMMPLGIILNKVPPAGNGYYARYYAHYADGKN